MVRSVSQCRLCRGADFPRFLNSANTCRCRPLPEVGQKLPLRVEMDIARYFRPLIIPYAKQADTLSLRKKIFSGIVFPRGRT